MVNINFTQLILALGGWSILIVSVTKYLSTITINRLKINWKASADKELAGYQAELNKGQTILSNIYTQYASGFHLGQERRIEAVEVLWTNLQSIVEFADTAAMFIYSTLTEAEIENYWLRKPNNQLFNKHKNELKEMKLTDFMNKFHPYCKQIDLERPFLGEQIFHLYNIYKIFLGRITYLVIQGAEKEKFTQWRDDEALVNILKNALAPQEYSYIMSLTNRTYEMTRNLLEFKLLEQINRLISGDTVTQNAVEMVKQYSSINSAIS